MAWTELTRRHHDRKADKYASDMTGAEWALIAPLMPQPRTTGRPRTTKLRAVFDAILYIATTGCQCRVRSRTVVWLFLEKFRFQFVPVFHGLQGRLAAQG